MMLEGFLSRLFQAAREAGFTVAEAYVMEDESFKAVATQGEITQYANHSTRGLGFRGLLNGRMGYAATEALDEAAVDQLVRGAKDSATYCEDDSVPLIYDGCEPVAEMTLTGQDSPAEDKLAFALAMERIAKAYDPRIAQVGYDTVITGRMKVRIVNTYGMDKQYEQSLCGAYLQPIAREGKYTATGMEIAFARDFQALNAETLAVAAARQAVEGLGAEPVPSGCYRAVILNLAMTDLLETFSPAFSAENAQKSLSLLRGKLGETVGAQCVTIVDDPLRTDALASRPFDAEGVPSRRNVVVDRGVFQTFLHNLKTAHQDGVASTGNASKGSYAASVRVAPTNFCIEAGEQPLEALLAGLGEGLVITEVEGLHAGANAVTGDFSLLSKGYTVRDGKRVRAVEQVTIAGNFFDLLKQIRAVGSDLRFPSGGFGSPSVDAGMLSVAGTEPQNG